MSFIENYREMLVLQLFIQNNLFHCEGEGLNCDHNDPTVFLKLLSQLLALCAAFVPYRNRNTFLGLEAHHRSA